MNANNSYARFLFYIVATYFIVFLSLSILRLWGFGFAISDFGLFQQLIWNTLEGRPFEYTAAYPFREGANYLGYYHFSIIPVIFALPFYALFPHPETLGVLHIFLVCVPAFIIYRICLKLKDSPPQALFWSVLYLFNPFTLHHAMFSYAEMSFAPIFIALALYFTISRNLRGLIITSLMLCMVKEHYAISMVGFGVVWAWYNKSWKQGFLLAVIGALLFAAIMGVIMPMLRDSTEHIMLSSAGNHSDAGMFKRYQWLMQEPAKVLSDLPEKLINPPNVKFLYALLVPLLLLPLFSGRLFLAAAISDLAAIFLSDFPIQKAINLNYDPAIVPALIIASAYSVNNGFIDKRKLRKHALVLVAILTLYFTYDVMRQPISKLSLVGSKHMDWLIGKDFADAMKNVPDDARVIADGATAAVIAERKYITGFNQSSLNSADYVMIRLSHYHYYFSSYDSLLANENSVVNLINSPSWGLIYWKYPYVIFKKNARDIRELSELKNYVETTSIRNNGQNYSPILRKDLE